MIYNILSDLQDDSLNFVIMMYFIKFPEIDACKCAFGQWIKLLKEGKSAVSPKLKLRSC